MKKSIRFMAILVVAMMMTGSAFAASPWTSASSWGDLAKGKLEFGVKNLFLGWIDLFQEPENARRDGRNIFAGIGKGLVDTFANMLGGAAHVATFPLTQVDVPLPENGVQI